VNLKGRERDGIVAPGESDKLLSEITSRLLAVRDPVGGAAVITRMDRASDAYNGPYARSGPDLIVGYNRGYRAGWRTILGAFPREVIENNMNPWSGDHCMDYTLVPGILLSNRAMAAQAASLTDIAPTILAEFGIAKAGSMIGTPLFSTQNTSDSARGQ
jgi:predicted AlkP superfamily phosphohydrolase/phosphomutase